MTGAHVFYVHTVCVLIRSYPWFYIPSGSSQRRKMSIFDGFRDTAVIDVGQPSQPRSWSSTVDSVKQVGWAQQWQLVHALPKSQHAEFKDRKARASLSTCQLLHILACVNDLYPTPSHIMEYAPFAHFRSCVCYSKCQPATPLLTLESCYRLFYTAKIFTLLKLLPSWKTRI